MTDAPTAATVRRLAAEAVRHVDQWGRRGPATDREDSMSDDELKPCPFCGSDDIRQEYGAGSKPPYNDPYVVCVDCGASVEGKSGAWNRRADLPTTPAEAMRLPEVMALVEAMRNAIEAIDAAYDGPDDNGRYSTRERAALAALEQAAHHD